MCKCPKSLALAHLPDFGVETAAIVVSRHKTEWGSRFIVVAGLACWNDLPTELRRLSVGPDFC